MTISAVIVAGGQGTRLGLSVPKAFVELGGKPLFVHSLATLASHPKVSETILVVPANLIDMARVAVKANIPKNAVIIVGGGNERWESVTNGVVACSPNAEWVLVHDAARPFVTHTVIDALIEKSGSFRAIITATRVDDTIRRFKKDKACGTVDRSELVRVGTPQLFDCRLLCKALESGKAMTPPPTDEAMLMEQMGVEVGIAWGDPLNFKITTPADLKIAEALTARSK